MSKSKREQKPLIDEDGEVRELLLEDIRKFRPAVEVLPASLLTKLGIRKPEEEQSSSLQTDAQNSLVRKQGEARQVAAAHYPYRCCVVRITALGFANDRPLGSSCREQRS